MDSSVQISDIDIAGTIQSDSSGVQKSSEGHLGGWATHRVRGGNHQDAATAIRDEHITVGVKRSVGSAMSIGFCRCTRLSVIKG